MSNGRSLFDSAGIRGYRLHPMYRTRLDLLARRSLLRRLRTIHSAPLAEVQLEGHQVLLFSSNNYLDLATHPKVAEAAITALRRYGVGAGASRLISGTFPPHVELEERLAAFKRTEATLVFAIGRFPNCGACSSGIRGRPR